MTWTIVGKQYSLRKHVALSRNMQVSFSLRMFPSLASWKRAVVMHDDRGRIGLMRGEDGDRTAFALSRNGQRGASVRLVLAAVARKLGYSAGTAFAPYFEGEALVLDPQREEGQA